MAIVIPPEQVHETAPQIGEVPIAKGYGIPNWSRVERAPDGGMVCYYLGHPVGRRGMPYPQAVSINNEVKRWFMVFFTSLTGIRKGFTGLLNELINNFCRLADAVYANCATYDIKNGEIQSTQRNPILKYEFYTPTSKAMWTLSETFLKEIGINGKVATRFGHILATILEYDDAYRLPIVDIMSEFSKEEILSNSPRYFLKKAVGIYASRIRSGKIWGEKLAKKLQNIAFLAGFLFFLPKYKRAFRKAFEAVDMTQLQWDDYDRYWSSAMVSYNYRGKSQPQRVQEIQALIDEVNFQREEGKFCSVCQTLNDLVPEHKGPTMYVICRKCQEALKHLNNETVLKQAIYYLNLDGVPK